MLSMSAKVEVLARFQNVCHYYIFFGINYFWLCLKIAALEALFAIWVMRGEKYFIHNAYILPKGNNGQIHGFSLLMCHSASLGYIENWVLSTFCWPLNNDFDFVLHVNSEGILHTFYQNFVKMSIQMTKYFDDQPNQLWWHTFFPMMSVCQIGKCDITVS